MGHYPEPRAKILIVGKLPPPIGGVRIHVQRLIGALRERNVNFDFFDLTTNSLYKLLRVLSRYKLVHLHSSNPWLQLGLSLHCRLIGVRSIVTFHGNLGRFGFLRNLATNFSVLLTPKPIVLNQESFHIACKWNRNSSIMSAYIPSSNTPELSSYLEESIQNIKNGHVYTFCTNASTCSTDKHDREIYGISDLIQHFTNVPKACLIISDPSSAYDFLYRKRQVKLPKNILLISEPHDFRAILHHVDGFIRNTTTDGMSISIDEALAAGKMVFATDCVSRPRACLLYRDLSEINFVEALRQDDAPEPISSHPDVVTALAQIYTKFLRDNIPRKPE